MLLLLCIFASKGVMVSPSLKMYLIGLPTKIEMFWQMKRGIGWLEELAFIASGLISLIEYVLFILHL